VFATPKELEEVKGMSIPGSELAACGQGHPQPTHAVGALASP
jgi:hypothetical protein